MPILFSKSTIGAIIAHNTCNARIYAWYSPISICYQRDMGRVKLLPLARSQICNILSNVYNFLLIEIVLTFIIGYCILEFQYTKDNSASILHSMHLTN